MQIEQHPKFCVQLLGRGSNLGFANAHHEGRSKECPLFFLID
jgi:hypothetical protein